MPSIPLEPDATCKLTQAIKFSRMPQDPCTLKETAKCKFKLDSFSSVTKL